MTEPTWTLKPENIEWEMDWSGTDKDGNRRHPDMPEKEMIFETDAALAHLLMNEVLFLNSHWYNAKEAEDRPPEERWPQKAADSISIIVNCNDVFAWGCADGEDLPYSEIENLYRLWKRDPVRGADVWCIIRRRELPQRPVAKRLTELGWDLEELTKEHNLRPNVYDSLSTLYARRKYDLYCEWERSRGNEPRPYDAKWWDGWKEYREAHPDFKEYGGEFHEENMRLPMAQGKWFRR